MPEKTKGRVEFLVNIAYFSIIAGIVYLIFKYLLSMILPFIVAFIIVSIMNPLIRRIQNRFPKQRSLISFGLMLALFIIVGLLLFFGIMTIVFWIKDLAIDFSDNYFNDVFRPNMTAIWDSISTYINQLPNEWQEQLVTIQSNIMSSAQTFVMQFSQRLLGWVTAFTGRVPGFFIALVFTVMLSFFVSIQYDEVIDFFRTQLPPKGIQVFKDLRRITRKSLFQYVRALFTMMIVTTIEVAIGLTILRVEHAILISIAIAIFDALPVFGVGTVLIPWAITELLKGDFSRAIGLVVLYGVVVLVRNIIEPKIVGDKLGINPIVSIVAIYFGFKTVGVLGMIFMPIVVQMLLELHKEETITLFRRGQGSKLPQNLMEEKAEIK